MISRMTKDQMGNLIMLKRAFLYSAVARLSLRDGAAGDGAAGGGAGGAGGAAGGDGGAGGAADTRTPEQRILAMDAKNKELLSDLKKLKDVAKAFEGLDPEKAKAAMQAVEKAEEERRKAAGDFEGIKRQMQDQHKVELTKEQERGKRLEGALYTAIADNQLQLALKEKGNPVLLLPHMRPFVKVVEDAESPTGYKAVVVDKSGAARVKDGAGTPVSIEDLIGEFRAKDEFADAFYVSNASGTGGGGGAGGDRRSARGSSTQLVVPLADEKDATKYRQYRERAVKEGKTLVLESQLVAAGR